MGSPNNALLQVEGSQTLNAFEIMTDADSGTRYNLGTVWSGYEGKAPVVRPDGVVTGFEFSASTTANKINIAAGTLYLKGELVSVVATVATIVRATTAASASISAITIASDGSVAIVKGAQNEASLTFSDTFAAAGGPPLSPITSVPIGWSKTTATTSAVITASEFIQERGKSQDRSDYPAKSVFNHGKGTGATTGEVNAYVKFTSANQLSRTGPASRPVYLEYYAVSLSDLAYVYEVVPPETTYTSSSEPTYSDGAVATSSEGLSNGSFSQLLDNGVTDFLQGNDYKGKTLTFKYFPDRDAGAYKLFQGKVGLATTNPYGAQIKHAATVVAKMAGANYDGS